VQDYAAYTWLKGSLSVVGECIVTAILLDKMRRKNMDKSTMIRGKKVLVTGGTGTVGKKLAQKLLELDAEVVRIYSRDEHKQYAIQEHFTYHGLDMKRIRFFLGDVRYMV